MRSSAATIHDNAAVTARRPLHFGPASEDPATAGAAETSDHMNKKDDSTSSLKSFPPALHVVLNTAARDALFYVGVA